MTRGLASDFRSARIERVFQASLFGDLQPGVDRSFGDLERRTLDERSWVDFATAWLSGADTVFAELVDALQWRQRTVTMYERRLPEPRLTSWWSGAHGPEPLPVLAAGASGVEHALRRTFRHDRVQLVSRRQRLRGLARGPARASPCRGRHRHRQRGRATSLPPAATRRRSVDRLRGRPRRPAGDGRRLSAPLAARGSQGPLRRAARFSITFRHGGVS